MRHEFLHKPQEERQHENGIDGLHQEFQTENAQGQDEQGGIDEEVGVLVRNLCGILYDSSHTGHASCHDFVGHEEEREAESVEDEAEGDASIVAGLAPHEFFVDSHGIGIESFFDIM